MGSIIRQTTKIFLCGAATTAVINVSYSGYKYYNQHNLNRCKEFEMDMKNKIRQMPYGDNINKCVDFLFIDTPIRYIPKN